MKNKAAGLAMFSFLALLAFALPGAATMSCPLCSGHIVEYCNIEITPLQRLVNKELTVNVTMAYMNNYTPIKINTTVEFWHYDDQGNITKIRYGTDAKGLVKYTPDRVAYYLVKVDRYGVCAKSVLIYVNTTCGDRVCGGAETTGTCASDCSSCGDGICTKATENLSCSDCAVCGDKKCTSGESRSNCLADCVFCGDNICDYVENRALCPVDCPSGAADGACDGQEDGKCDPDCGQDSDIDCKPKVSAAAVQPEKSGGILDTLQENPIYLGAAIAALVIVAVLASIVEMRKEKAVKSARVMRKIESGMKNPSARAPPKIRLASPNPDPAPKILLASPQSPPQAAPEAATPEPKTEEPAAEAKPGDEPVQ
jgi:hypothetical protein